MHLDRCVDVGLFLFQTCLSGGFLVFNVGWMLAGSYWVLTPILCGLFCWGTYQRVKKLVGKLRGPAAA